MFFQKTFHIKTLIQHRILLQGDLREVFIRRFITKWGCGADAARAECAGYAVGAAVTDAGWHRAASLARSLETHGVVGTAKNDAALAVEDPHRLRQARLRTPAVAVAILSPMRGAAVPGVAAPGTPIAPTTLPPARHTTGMPRAETAVTELPGSPSPPALGYYCAGPDRTAAAVSVRSAALPTSTPLFL